MRASTIRRRPFGVMAIAALQVVNAALAAWRVGTAEETVRAFFETAEAFELAGIVFGLAGLGAAVGLLLLRRWGWTVAMLLAGLNLAVALLAYTRGEPQFGTMAVSVAVVFYLNQRDVQVAFGQAIPREAGAV